MEQEEQEEQRRYVPHDVRETAGRLSWPVARQYMALDEDGRQVNSADTVQRGMVQRWVRTCILGHDPSRYCQSPQIT